MQNQLSKPSPFIKSPCTVYNTPICDMPKPAVFLCFTVVLCFTYVAVLNLFCIKQLFTNLISFHFQTRDSNTHAYMTTHGCQTMVTETSKATNFRACFFYSRFLYWLAILFISITFFYWQVFIMWVKKPTKQSPCRPFLL